MSIEKIKEFLPFYAKAKCNITNITVVAETKAPAAQLSVWTNPFMATGDKNGDANILKAEVDGSGLTTSVVVINTSKASTPMLRAWAVVRFTV